MAVEYVNMCVVIVGSITCLYSRHIAYGFHSHLPHFMIWCNWWTLYCARLVIICLCAVNDNHGSKYKPKMRKQGMLVS